MSLIPSDALPCCTKNQKGALSDSKGVIEMREATGINSPGQCHWPKEDNVPKEASPLLRLEIVTATRVFKLFATDGPSATEWVAQLEKVRSGAVESRSACFGWTLRRSRVPTSFYLIYNQVRQHLASRASWRPPTFTDIAEGMGYQTMLAQLGAVNA